VTRFDDLLKKFPNAAQPLGTPSPADGEVLEPTPVKRRGGKRLDRVVALAVDLERNLTRLTERVLDLERRVDELELKRASAPARKRDVEDDEDPAPRDPYAASGGDAANTGALGDARGVDL
jgi:hypothetical protein